MMNKEEVKQGVAEAIEKVSGLDIFKENGHLINDLGLDSLDRVEMIMDLETKFDVSIPDEELESLETPKMVVDYILRALEDK